MHLMEHQEWMFCLETQCMQFKNMKLLTERWSKASAALLFSFFQTHLLQDFPFFDVRWHLRSGVKHLLLLSHSFLLKSILLWEEFWTFEDFGQTHPLKDDKSASLHVFQEKLQYWKWGLPEHNSFLMCSWKCTTSYENCRSFITDYMSHVEKSGVINVPTTTKWSILEIILIQWIPNLVHFIEWKSHTF